MYLTEGNNIKVNCKMIKLDNYGETLDSIIQAQKHADEKEGLFFVIYDIKIVSHSNQYGNGVHYAYIFYRGQFPDTS